METRDVCAADSYSENKRDKVMPYAAAWMGLEIIVPSEVVRQSKTNTMKYFLQGHI